MNDLGPEDENMENAGAGDEQDEMPGSNDGAAGKRKSIAVPASFNERLRSRLQTELQEPGRNWSSTVTIQDIIEKLIKFCPSILPGALLGRVCDMVNRSQGPVEAQCYQDGALSMDQVAASAISLDTMEEQVMDTIFLCCSAKKRSLELFEAEQARRVAGKRK